MEAQGQGPRKKASPQAAQSQSSGPAKGFLLRTSSMSDDEPDSEVEIDTENVVWAFCVRIVEQAQSPDPKLAPHISEYLEKKVQDPQTIRSRNSRSAGKGIPFADMHNGKEYLDDCPDLVDNEGNIKQSPEIWPSLTNIREHAPFHWYDSPKTVSANDTLYILGEQIYFRHEDRLYPLNSSKRGPHRPSQSILEQQAMSINVEYCLDPERALEDHHYNPRKNAFRAKVILQVAVVDFDHDYAGERTHLIAKIIDQDNSSNPDVLVFVNKQEYDAYLEACDLAAGTGWAVHMAQDCERRYEQNMRICFGERAHNHDIRSLQDPVYW
jgi:hypothetical protein